VRENKKTFRNVCQGWLSDLNHSRWGRGSDESTYGLGACPEKKENEALKGGNNTKTEQEGGKKVSRESEGREPRRATRQDAMALRKGR